MRLCFCLFLACNHKRRNQNCTSNDKHATCDNQRNRPTRQACFFVFFRFRTQAIYPSLFDGFHVRLLHLAYYIKEIAFKFQLIRLRGEFVFEFVEVFLLRLFVVKRFHCVVSRGFARSKIIAHYVLQFSVVGVFADSVLHGFVFFVRRFDFCLRCRKLGCVNIIISRISKRLLVGIKHHATENFRLIPRRIELHARKGNRLIFHVFQQRVVIFLRTFYVNARKGVAVAFRCGSIIIKEIPFRFPQRCARKIARHTHLRCSTVRGNRRFIKRTVRERIISVRAVFERFNRRFHRGSVERNHVEFVVCVSAHNVPALCIFIRVRQIIQLRAFRIRRRFRHFRSREIYAVVCVFFHRVGVAVGGERFGFITVELRCFERIRADTVKHRFPKIDVRIRRVVLGVKRCLSTVFHRFVALFFEIFSVEFIFLTAFHFIRSHAVLFPYAFHARRCVYAVKLVIRSGCGIVGICTDHNGHRVIYVPVRGVARVVEIGIGFGKYTAYLFLGIERFQITVLFVKAIYHVPFFHETVVCRVGRKTEIIIFHRFRTVELGALEVNPRRFHFTVHILVGGGGCVIHVIAVNINTCVKVLRNEEHRYYGFRFIVVPSVQIRLFNTHQRAFYHVAVNVRLGVVFCAVNEINEIAFLYGKATVRLHLRARYVAVEFFSRVGGVATCKRSR